MWQTRAQINSNTVILLLALLGVFVLLALVAPPPPVDAQGCQDPNRSEPWDPPILCRNTNTPCANCWIVKWSKPSTNRGSFGVRWRFAPHGAWTNTTSWPQAQFVIPNSSSHTYVEAQWKRSRLVAPLWSNTGAGGTRPTNTPTNSPSPTYTPTNTPTPNWDSTATALAPQSGILVWEKCTLHQAIQSANENIKFGRCKAGATSGTDTITLLQDVTLTGDVQAVESDIRIEGNGFTINGDDKFRPFTVNSTSRLELNNVSIINGKTADAGQTNGGAIVSNGTVIITNSYIGGSHAVNSGGAISTNGPALTISNSTIHNNRANGKGGGIYVIGGTVTLSHVTMVGNQASFSQKAPLHIYGGTVKVRNTIITADSAHKGCDFDTHGSTSSLSENKGNLIENNDCGGTVLAGPAQLQARSSAKPYYIMPAAGSPAIGAGDNGICAQYATDQRGGSRPSTGCDIGAVQFVSQAQQGPTPSNEEATQQAAVLAAGSYSQFLMTRTPPVQRPQSGYQLNKQGYSVSANHGLGSGVNFQRVGAAGIGIQWIIDAGFLDAIDVWGYVQQGVEVCFTQAGSIIFKDSLTIPAQVYSIPYYANDMGLPCAYITSPGTLILMPLEGILSTALTDCMVTALYILNLREEPAGQVIGLVPKDDKLTAISRTPDWFEVDYHGVYGWISAQYVQKHGDCG